MYERTLFIVTLYSLFSFFFPFPFFFSKKIIFKLESSNLTNLDTTTVCGPNDPVVLYVHCSPIKPDPHVRIRRPTTAKGIPPVITVTGIKKEGRIPHILDERPNGSVKIIVLDLRSNDDPNNNNHSQPESKFKKMSFDFWENVLHIVKAYSPNQATDCAIKASPSVDIYTNIVPPRQPVMAPLPSFNSSMFHPHMYTSSPVMFNQPNYMSVMTAAQYIMNAAAAYNTMLGQQQYSMIHSPVVSPQPHHVQIKRKPVQYHPQPTNPYTLSPQIEQRIQRKKVPSPRQPLPQKQEKKVRFEEVPTLYTYEPQEEEEEQENEEFYDDHYTHPYASTSRPWSSNIILNNRNNFKNYHYDDQYQEEDDYEDLWEKRQAIQRHDSLGHRSPIRRSRV